MRGRGLSGGGREIHSPAGNGFGSSALTGASENHPGWDMKPQWGMRSRSDYWNSRQQPGLFPSGLPSLRLYHCPFESRSWCILPSSGPAGLVLFKGDCFWCFFIFLWTNFIALRLPWQEDAVY